MHRKLQSKGRNSKIHRKIRKSTEHDHKFSGEETHTYSVLIRADWSKGL